MSVFSSSSHLSLNRESRWGTTDYFATSFLHFSVLRCPLGLGELQACLVPDVVFHFFFFFLTCLLPPFTVPCKAVLARPDERGTCPCHCSLRPFTIARSSCGPIACWILARTSSLVKWSLYEMCSILRLCLISMACILLWSSAMRVHDSQAYRKMDITRKRIRRILELKEILLSFQAGLLCCC